MTGMTREMALPYVSFCVDNAQSEHPITDIPADARLVGWQCGFEPMFVAVWSYLNIRLDDEEAEDLATELLKERAWFASEEAPPPDYII